MYIPESLVWAIGSDGASGIYFHCAPENSERVAKFFNDTFNEEWADAMEKANEKYDDVEDISGVAIASVDENGVFVSLDPLYIPYSDGDYYDCEFAGKALDNTLRRIEKEFKGISYEGYIAYFASDAHAGEVIQYPVKSSDIKEERKAFEFIAQALWDMDDDELIDQAGDFGADDFKELLVFINDHVEFLTADEMFDRILDVADEVDEDLRETLEETIQALNNGDEVALPSKDIDAPDPPDGYMDALKAFLGADDDDEEDEGEDND